MSKDALTAGVLLAAGAGSRYGMPKVLAEKGDWLKLAVAALAGGGCDEVIVVLGAAGADVVDVPAPARAVYAANWADGLSASLRAGLDAVDSAFAVPARDDEGRRRHPPLHLHPAGNALRKGGFPGT